MLDTIRLEIGDINGRHSPLVQFLIQKRNTRVDSTKYGVSSNGEYRNDRMFLEREFVFWSATNRATEKMSMVTTHLPSSNYKIRYTINYAYNTMTVEFSLPKYVYGTNILMTTFNPNDKDFDPYNEHKNSIEYQFSLIKSRFNAYVLFFLKNEFPGYDVDLTLVSLKRLDLCYNLVFPKCANHEGSSEDCMCKDMPLRYLELQKGMRKKRQRDNTTAQTNYNTSIFLKNADYSFKIYHKGEEYLVNDRSKHIKLNEQFNKHAASFDWQSLQSFADRTLRFEMTFRSSYISKIFNQLIRRTDMYIDASKTVLIKRNVTIDNFRQIFNRLTVILQNRINWDKYRFNQNKLPLNKAVLAFTLTTQDELMCCNYVAFMGMIDRCRNQFHERSGLTYMDLFYRMAGLNKQSPLHDLKAFDCFYGKMSAYYSKHHSIYLKLGVQDLDDFKEHYSKTGIDHFYKISFTEDVCNEMAKRFISTIYDFEVKSLTKFPDFKRRILENPPKGVEITNLLSTYKLICLGFSIPMQAQMFNWAPSTKTKYIKRFDALGVNKQHITTSNKVQIKFNFAGYFDEISNNKYQYLFNLKSK